jgi:predicted RND superfamily exporter protein
MAASIASPRMEELSRLVAANPWLTVLLTLLVTGLALQPLQAMDTETSLEDYLPPSEEVSAGQVAYGDFPLPFYVSAVVEMPGGNLLARESLQELLRLEAHLRARPEVQVWAYNTSAVVRSPGSAVASTLALQNLTVETAPDPALQATLGALIEDPQAGGMFGAPSQADGVWQARSVFVTVTVDKQGAYNDEASELAVRDAFHSFESESLVLNSMAAPNQAMQEASQKTLGTLLPLTLAAMAMLLWVSLRRISDVVLSLGTVMLALLWMFAAGELLDLRFSQYTFIAPILVLALGVDDAIHILHRYRADHYQGPERALRISVRLVGTALLLTTLTTMAAFGANRVSAVPAIRDFGVHVALGIGAAFILTTTFLPAVRLLLDRRLDPDLKPLDEGGVLVPALGRLAAASQARPLPVIAVALLLASGSLWAALQLDQELEMVDLIDPSSEMYRAWVIYERDFASSSGEESGLLIEGDDLARPEVLRALLETQAAMADDTKVAQLGGQPRAYSIATVMREVFPLMAPQLGMSDSDGDGLPDSATETRQLLGILLAEGAGDMTPTEVRALARPDGNGSCDGMLIRVISADIRMLGGGDLLRELEEDDAPLEALGLESTAYGQPVERYQMLSTMTDGMLKSLALSIVICLGLLIALRRSWVEGIEAIIPVLLVTAWVYGTIWALGWSLNLVTVSIAAITIGVGVDFAVHLLHRYREALADGELPEGAMVTAVQQAGTPITGAALTTAAGFGVLGFSPMTSFSQFGVLTAIMILYALTATLLVLPAVVLTVARYRAPPAFPPRDDAGAAGAPDNVWGENDGSMPNTPPRRVVRRVKKVRRR